MSELLQRALELGAQRIPVFPCKADKGPLTENGFKDAVTDELSIRRLFSKKQAVLIGVPTGERSGFNALDLDYRHGAGEWGREAELPWTRVHKTPGLPKPKDAVQTAIPGRHYLFKHHPGVRISAGQVFDGIDVRGEGGYVCFPPCGGYQVESDCDLADLPEWPEWLLPLVLHRESVPRPAPVLTAPGAVSDKRVSGYLRTQLDKVSRAPDGRKHTILRDAALVLGGHAVGFGLTDEYLLQELVNALPDTVENWHNAKKTAEWGLSRGRLKPLTLEDRPLSDRPKITSNRPPEELEPDTWMDDVDFIRGGKENNGKITGCLANAILALSEAPAWRGVFSFDLFASKIIVNKHFPGKFRPDETFPHELSEIDITRVTDWLQHHYIPVVSFVAHEAVAAVARDNEFHPVRAYLKKLKWDGVPRIDTWLITYLGAENNKLNRAFGSKWLMGGVARVMVPGCKMDTILILEGIQGIGKSTAINILASPWTASNMPDVASKDAMEQLQGVWIIEMAELGSFSKAESNKIKLFLSNPSDRFRPSYGRFPQNFPRQCIFAGTTNDESYLDDPTGGRRFWPVACGIGWEKWKKLDRASLTLMRDQMWAEAYERYKSGESWYLDDDELQEQHEVAASDRLHEETWTTKISEYLRHKQSTTIGEVLANAVNVSIQDQDKRSQTRAGNALKSLKWWKRKGPLNGDRVWIYYPPREPVVLKKDR